MKSSFKIKNLIIGAGPTGLGAAYRFQELNVGDWLLLEGEAFAGGLATSFRDGNGFFWDIGGHVQFSHYSYFDQAMIKFLGVEGWLKHQRESWVWMRNKFIPYPLQNNIHHLPKDELLACLEGMVEITGKQLSYDNFEEWIEAYFGSGLAKAFMVPYNFKVWAYPPSKMNTIWVGERVSVVNLKNVLKNLVNNTDEISWGPNSVFQFPIKGGTGAIWSACAETLPKEKIHYNCRINKVDVENKQVFAENGNVYEYQNLISTIPLIELIKLSNQNQFQEIAEKGLLHSSSNIIGIGLKGTPSEQLKSKCWMYFPENNCPFYRVTVFSNYSPNNVPDANLYWSLMCEVSESQDKPIDHDTLIEDVIEGCLNTNLFENKSDIASVWSYRANYGYPTPGLHRDEALDVIIPFYDAASIFSRGRFGMWKYEVSNQDHSFMQGVEIAEKLTTGKEEITAFDPNYANSKKHDWPFEKWHN